MSDDEATDPEPSEASEASETADEPAAPKGEAADEPAADESAPKSEAADESAAESSPARPSRRKRRKRPASEAGDDAKPSGSSGTKTKTTSDAKAASGAGGDSASAERRDLPKWNRARVKRKAPKGEDEDAFQSTVRKAGQGILQRPMVVLGLIVAVGGIGAGAYTWMQARKGDRAEATALLSTAAAYQARGKAVPDLAARMAERERPLPGPYAESDEVLTQKVDAALSDLEALDPSAPANEVADLMRAARLHRARDFEGAEKAYRNFVERLPGHRLVFMAREGLVLALEGQERWDDALAEVEPMMGDEGDFYRDQALWHRGRLLEAAGRTDEALEVYRQYMAEYPLDKPSLASREVRERLEELDPGSVPPLPDAGIPGMPGMPPGLGIGP